MVKLPPWYGQHLNKDASMYEKALSMIDEQHALDPNKVTVDGMELPYEFHYALKMSEYLEKRAPSASDELKLAVRAQHFRRWEVARSTYPMTRIGYYAWRTFLKQRQAKQAYDICVSVGYSEEKASRIASMIKKQDMKQDEETQILEDVACLVFLDDQFEEFEKGHDEEKIVKILQRTWGKMSDRGHELALEIKMSDRAKGLITKALLP